jgi:uncharacterized protein (TIGR03083 family)
LTNEGDPQTWLRAVRRSHDRLVGTVENLAQSELDRPSYCTEWSVAQVLSHLGSQAEIFSRFVDAGLQGTAAPAQADFPSIWDAWNGRGPLAQAMDSAAANDALLERLERLDPGRLATFRLQMFGMDVDALGLLRMRLSEHAVHSWDVMVALNPGAVIAPDAVELLAVGLPETAARVGRPSPMPWTADVTTTSPNRSYHLSVDDAVRLDLQRGDGRRGDEASLAIPAETLVRLVYGRLGSTVTGNAVEVTGLDLDEVRRAFPGF